VKTRHRVTLGQYERPPAVARRLRHPVFVWTDTAVPRFPPPAPGQRGVIPPSLHGPKRGLPHAWTLQEARRVRFVNPPSELPRDPGHRTRGTERAALEKHDEILLEPMVRL
jgi:hypothetical protein